MAEFYRNEVPTGSESGGWGGATGGGFVGSWGGGSGGSGSGATGETPSEDPWYLLIGKLESAVPKILTNGDDFIQLDPDGAILTATSGCIDLKIYCQIQGTSSSYHVDCILLAFVVDSTGNSVDHNTVLWTLGLPNGRLRLRAKWQAGHYDYASIHTVRFRIAGQITPWIKLSMTDYLDVAQLAVRDGQIIVTSARSL